MVIEPNARLAYPTRLAHARPRRSAAVAGLLTRNADIDLRRDELVWVGRKN